MSSRSEHPGASPYLPSHYEFDENANLDIKSRIDSGQKVAWELFIKEGNVINALQLAEAELETLTTTNQKYLGEEARALSRLGETYLMLMNVDEGLRYYAEACAIFKALGEEWGRERTQFYADWLCHGIVTDAVSKVEPALELLRKELTKESYANLSELRYASLRWAHTLTKLAEKAEEYGRIDFAETLRVECLELVRAHCGPSSLECYIKQFELGDLYLCSDRHKEALPYIEAARKGLEEKNEAKDLSFCIVALKEARIRCTEGEYIQSLLLLRKAKQALPADTAAFAPITRDILMMRAEIKEARGKYKKAEELLWRAATILEEYEVPVELMLDLLRKLAETTGKRGSVNTEADIRKTMLDLCVAAYGVLDSRTFECHKDLISFLDRNGRYHSAFRETKDLTYKYRQVSGKEGYFFLNSLIDLAYAYEQLGRTERSSTILRAVFTTARRVLSGQDRALILEVADHLAKLEEKKGLMQSALHLRRRNEKLSRVYHGKGSIEHGTALLDLAGVYLDMEETALAQMTAEKGLAVFDCHGRDGVWGRVRGLELLACIDEKEDTIDSAIMRLEQARGELAAEDSLSSSAGIAIHDFLGALVHNQTAIIPDKRRAEEALKYLIFADEAAADIQEQEGQATLGRVKRIIELADMLDLSDLKERASIRCMRLQLEGIGEEDKDPETDME